MAGIHSQARPRRRERVYASSARARNRQRMNSPPGMPSPLKRATRRNRLQPVSNMPGREFIHGRHSRPGPISAARARMRVCAPSARQAAANEFAACYAKPAQAGCAGATGFSRFPICQAVNSFMAGLCQARSSLCQARSSRLRAATGCSRLRICQAAIVPKYSIVAPTRMATPNGSASSSKSKRGLWCG
jgi:hypothetical protein